MRPIEMLCRSATAAVRTPLVAATALALALGATAFGPATKARAADPSIVVARAMDFNSLDPARGFCDTCQIYLTAVYDTLVTLGADNKSIVPRLASKWEIAPDLKTFTFHLAPGAKFSDGSPVEAKDVQWSLVRLKNMKGGPSFLMDSLDSIETPDPQTAVIKLTGPSSEFLGMLAAAYAGIVNSDLASANGANANADAATSDTADAWFQAHSAGSGPFVLESYKADDEVRLARNDSFWGKKPAISGVIMKQTADAVTQAQMLQSGTADVAMQVDPDTANTISDPNIVFKTVPSFNFVYLAFSPVASGSPVPLSKDVREAIALAIDYKGAIDLAIGGQGALQPVAIPNGFPGTDKLPEPALDLDKARALLAKAGLSSGFELTLEFPNMNVYGVDLSLLAQKIQQDLAKIDVKLTLKPVSFNVWLTDISAPIPFTIGFYAPDYFGSAQYVQYFAMIPGMPWGKRAGAGKAPGLDGVKQAELFQKALATAPGPGQDDAYRAIAMEMIGDRIIIPILSPNLVLAYRKDIDGVRYSACCNLPLDEITKH